MDEFLKIVWQSQENVGAVGTTEDFFYPVMNRLKELLSPKLYASIETEFTDCLIQNNDFYATAGMKLAIGVLEKKYLPKF